MRPLVILPPTEIQRLTADLMATVEQQPILETTLSKIGQTAAAFERRWQAAYTRFGSQPAGELAYRDALLYFQAEVSPLVRRLPVDGAGQQVVTTIETMLGAAPLPPQRINRQLLTQVRQQRRQKNAQPEPIECPEFDRPLFIVSAPRAGSTLLFETLARLAEVWTIGAESHDIETGIAELHPAAGHYASNRLTAAEATPAVSSAVRRWFSDRLQNREGGLYRTQPAAQRPSAVRFLEKTPKNALRIPFLKAVFPEARFIFLYREPRQNISSLLEGWRSGRFVAYRQLPGWPYQYVPWNFLLIPDWQTLCDRPLVEIVARQWRAANEQIWADLQRLPPTDWLFVTYADLTEQPVEALKRISRFAELRWDESLEQAVTGGLPLSRMVVSPPAPDKWREHAAEIVPILPTLKATLDIFEERVTL